MKQKRFTEEQKAFALRQVVLVRVASAAWPRPPDPSFEG
jgi:hypothetical protein